LKTNKKGKAQSLYQVEVYKNYGIDQLVVYAVKRILDANEECTFERLVYECFTLFPEKFEFKRYPEWPDSSRITKSWLRCRTDKGWIAGTVKEGFRITSAGEIIAKKAKRDLSSGYTSKKIQPPKKSRERYEAVLAHIKKSPEFLKSVEIEGYDISLSELKSFLGGTLETPKRILRHNLNLYFQAAAIYNDSSVIPFLKRCKKKLEKIGG